VLPWFEVFVFEVLVSKPCSDEQGFFVCEEVMIKPGLLTVGWFYHSA
jgi:hypothetical protein